MLLGCNWLSGFNKARKKLHIFYISMFLGITNKITLFWLFEEFTYYLRKLNLLIVVVIFVVNLIDFCYLCNRNVIENVQSLINFYKPWILVIELAPHKQNCILNVNKMTTSTRDRHVNKTIKSITIRETSGDMQKSHINKTSISCLLLGK